MSEVLTRAEKTTYETWMKYLDKRVVDLPGLITFWDFSCREGKQWLPAAGAAEYPLTEVDQPLEQVAEGIFGSHSARFAKRHWCYIPREKCPALNIHGKDAQFTMVAWLKRERGPTTGCQAVAGMWNEYHRRQYAMFLNLQFDGQRDQVGAHVSATGGPTPPHPYCHDAALGNTPVPFEEWVCATIVYDAYEARAYLNGKLDVSPGRNPFHYPRGIFDGGPEGAHFTVGAVSRPNRVDQITPGSEDVGNSFEGLLGGLAVYNRALTESEIRSHYWGAD
jgi:hypothetical protein